MQALPGADADQVDLDDGATPTTTTTTSATSTSDDSTTTTTAIPLDADTAAYLETLGGFEEQLTGFQTTMSTVNAQWDADPRQIDYSAAESALVDLVGQLGAWSDGVAAVAAPVALADGHAVVTQAAELVASTGSDVLEGLRGPTAEPRLTALEQFDAAVRAFTAAVDDTETQARAGA